VLVLAVLVFFTVRRRAQDLRWQDEDAFLLLAAVLMGLYFFSPEKMSGGSMLKPRLTLFPVLVLMAWLAPLPASSPVRGLRRGAIAALTVLAVWNLVKRRERLADPRPRRPPGDRGGGRPSRRAPAFCP